MKNILVLIVAAMQCIIGTYAGTPAPTPTPPPPTDGGSTPTPPTPSCTPLSTVYFNDMPCDFNSPNGNNCDSGSLLWTRTWAGECASGMNCDPFYGAKVCYTFNGASREIPSNAYTCTKTGGVVTTTMNVPLVADAVDYESVGTCQNKAFVEFVLGVGLDGAVNAGQAFICPESVPCPSARRQLVVTNDADGGNVDEIEQLTEKCGGYEYEGFLHVTNHITLLAVPSHEAQSAGCPYLSAHSVIEPSSALTKEAKLFFDRNEFYDLYPSHEVLSFGNFAGIDIVTAYHSADVGNLENDTYDIIKNNCATFALGLGSKLGVAVDTRVVSFVTGRLLASAGSDLAMKIRESVHFPSLFGQDRRALRGDSISDDKLVELLVETATSKML